MKYRIAKTLLFVFMAAAAFAADAATTQTDAQKSFDKLKTLSGEWEGVVTVPEVPEWSGHKLHVSMRVTSRGNTLVHELQEAGTRAGGREPRAARAGPLPARACQRVPHLLQRRAVHRR